MTDIKMEIHPHKIQVKKWDGSAWIVGQPWHTGECIDLTLLAELRDPSKTVFIVFKAATVQVTAYLDFLIILSREQQKVTKEKNTKNT